MKVLVTGASGFIGRPLVRLLLDRGHRVRALVRAAGEPALPGEEVVIGDIRDAGAVDRATRGTDVVVHLACATGVAREKVARAVNVAGTRRLLDAARANGARRFVFVSSISAVRERMGPYGRTKREGEELVAASGLDWVVLRPSLVYGPGGLFARLLRALRAPRFPLIGDGSLELDPVHVDDVCLVIEQCLVRDDVTGKAYDVLGPERLGFEAFLRRVADAIGAQPRFVHLPAALALPMAHVLGWLMERPPLTVDNVLGMTSPARVDGTAARRDFAIEWTPLATGLQRLAEVA